MTATSAPTFGSILPASRNPGHPDRVTIHGDDGMKIVTATQAYAHQALVDALQRVVDCGDKEPDRTCAGCVKLARQALALVEDTPNA